MSNTHIDILLAGAFAAFSVDLLIYPLDTLKTRFQSPDYARLYTNAAKQLDKKIFFRGLYQGLGSVILATIPSSGAFFTTYEATKSLLTNHNPKYNGHGLVPQPLIHALSSSTAEIVSCFILTPAEVLKQNAQMIDKDTSSSSTKSPTRTATVQALQRFSHPSQLWRGYTALVARNLPFTALQFPMFELLKERFTTYRRKQTGSETRRLTLAETAYVTGISAGSAGAVAAVVTTPVDVVKTRIMLSAASSGVSKDGPSNAMPVIEKMKGSVTKGHTTSLTQYKSGLTVAREVLQDSGWKGLMRGGTFRGAWTFLGSGLYLGVYESARVILEDRRSDKDIRSFV